MSQSPSVEPVAQSERRPDLKQHYKPVGIGAVTAAALCKSPKGGKGGTAAAPQRR